MDPRIYAIGHRDRGNSKCWLRNLSLSAKHKVTLAKTGKDTVSQRSPQRGLERGFEDKVYSCLPGGRSSSMLLAHTSFQLIFPWPGHGELGT